MAVSVAGRWRGAQARAPRPRALEEKVRSGRCWMVQHQVGGMVERVPQPHTPPVCLLPGLLMRPVADVAERLHAEP